METHKKLNPALAAIIIIVLISIVTSVVIVVNGTKKDGSETAQTSDPSVTESINTTSSDVSNYKDGTYSAKASYITPGAAETINLTVTIKDGAIVAISVVASGNTDHAQEHQSDFIAGYKDKVVGKNVDTVSLSRVSGASLTSQAFNKALGEIKVDARQ